MVMYKPQQDMGGIYIIVHCDSNVVYSTRAVVIIKEYPYGICGTIRL